MIRELREQPADLVGLGVGADVEVLGRAPHHQVAHAAAHQVGRVARVVEAVEDFEGVLVDVSAGDGVLGARQDARLHFGVLAHGFAHGGIIRGVDSHR